MLSIFLPYYQRVILCDLTGAHSVERLTEAAVLLRVIEKVRLTDEETIESEFRNTGAQISWNLPAPGYGDRLVELENEEAKALAAVIERVRGVRVSDARWLMQVLEKLQSPRPNAELVAAGRNHNADDVA